MGPIEGFVIHWVGPRRYMILGVLVFGVGLITVGLSQSILQFYLAFLLTTLGQTMAGFLPTVTVLINWFRKWRGRAIGVYQLGNSFGALIVPVVAWFILNVGWRQTVVVMGILVILIGLPIASLMRARPEEYGYLPDGGRLESRSPSASQTSENSATPLEARATILEVLRGRSFWLLALAHSLSLTSWGAIRVHQIPALVDMGLNEQTAANIFSVSLVVAAAGRLLGGFLGDFLGARNILIVAFLVQAGSLVILASASTVAHAMVFAVLFGIAFGARGTLLTVLRGELFGRVNFSRLSGLMDSVTTLGAVMSPLFAGYAYDVQGSYRFAFLVIAALNGIGVLLLFGIRFPARRTRPSGTDV